MLLWLLLLLLLVAVRDFGHDIGEAQVLLGLLILPQSCLFGIIWVACGITCLALLV